MSVGELAMLNKLLKVALTADENYILKLYKTNVTPDINSTQASFVESDFTSYVAKTLTRTGWNSAAMNGVKAESSYTAVQSWTCGTTGNTVYGYWVVGDGANAGTVLWAELFSTSRVLANGDVLNITPKFTLASEY